MILSQILLATVLGGLLSVAAAAWLSFHALSRLGQPLISLSAGLLLSTAILHLIPEAFESQAGFHELSWTLLAGIVGFFLLEKFAILRHAHHHEGDGHAHERGHDRREAGPGGLLILVGDSVHNFADGVLIAAAFLTDPMLGWLTTLSIVAHEVPQETGDFIVLVNAGYSRRRAFAYNLAASAAAIAGGLLGWWFLEHSQALLPFLLVLSAASFIYIALADLVPDMQRQHRRRESAIQFALMMAGVGVIAVLTSAMHAH